MRSVKSLFVFIARDYLLQQLLVLWNKLVHLMAAQVKISSDL